MSVTTDIWITAAYQRKLIDFTHMIFHSFFRVFGRLYCCGLTVLSCESIGEALKCEASALLELNLSNNSLKDAGFKIICEGMYAWCSLQKLK